MLTKIEPVPLERSSLCVPAFHIGTIAWPSGSSESCSIRSKSNTSKRTCCTLKAESPSWQQCGGSHVGANVFGRHGLLRQVLVGLPSPSDGPSGRVMPTKESGARPLSSGKRSLAERMHASSRKGGGGAGGGTGGSGGDGGEGGGDGGGSDGGDGRHGGVSGGG